MAVLHPKIAISLIVDAVTSAPPTNAAGVMTVRSRMAMECKSYLSIKGGRNGIIRSIRASIAIVPYLMICSLMVSSMGDYIYKY